MATILLRAGSEIHLQNPHLSIINPSDTESIDIDGGNGAVYNIPAGCKFMKVHKVSYSGYCRRKMYIYRCLKIETI